LPFTSVLKPLIKVLIDRAKKEEEGDKKKEEEENLKNWKDDIKEAANDMPKEKIRTKGSRVSFEEEKKEVKLPGKSIGV